MIPQKKDNKNIRIKLNTTFEDAMKKALTTPFKKISPKPNDKAKPNKSV